MKAYAHLICLFAFLVLASFVSAVFGNSVWAKEGLLAALAGAYVLGTIGALCLRSSKPKASEPEPTEE